MDPMIAERQQVSTFAEKVANCFLHIKGVASKPTNGFLLHVL